MSAKDDLGEAGDAVFAAAPGEVVGPLPTSLGPALFRMNAVIGAQEMPFEEAAPDLRAELANERARRQIDSETQGLADLIAGGASVEDLAETSALELGQIDWGEGVTGGIADYDEFRAAAAAAEEGAFPELVELEDGGVFALRLDAVVPPAADPVRGCAGRPSPQALLADRTREALAARADSLAEDLPQRRRVRRSGAADGRGPDPPRLRRGCARGLRARPLRDGPRARCG